MSGGGPAGPAGEGSNPFEGIFGDLARLLNGAGSGPLNWDVARQVAVLIAGEGKAEPNIEPVERIRLEELIHVAELHVSQVTGQSGLARSVQATTHIDWSLRTLDDWRSLFEKLAEALESDARSENTEDDLEDADPVLTDPGLEMLGPLGDLEKFVAPILLGTQVGGMVGHLARRSLGQLDLPLPRNSIDTIVLVPANIKAFADEWSLPLDELTLFVCLEEVARASVLRRPHVRDRLSQLLEDYVSAFRPDPQALQDQLSGMELTDPSQLPSMLNDPQALFGAIQTPEQIQTLAQISALVAALVGYVDWVVAGIARKAIPASPVIFEAVKRRRVKESDGHRLVEKLLGLELSQGQFDRGEAFITGVLNRSSELALARLWASSEDLPTPAEVDAPGLWLARIGVPVDETKFQGTIPDDLTKPFDGDEPFS